MKKILITGASGFLGKALCTKYAQEGFQVLGVSRNQKNLLSLHQDLQGSINVAPCNVASSNEVQEVFRNFEPEVVIHAAATKFVDWAEKHPNDCINNNVIGSQNVLEAAEKYGVKEIIAISTDKASPPVKNIYGLTKATMERLYTLRSNDNTKITCVRYGNVLGSTGSVLTIWKDAHFKGLPLKLTGGHMNRFFFSVHDAVNLIDYSWKKIEQTEGKIVSQKMKVANMVEVLNAFLEIYPSEVQYGESRPGERVDEILIAESEYQFTEALDDKHFLLHINSVTSLQNHIPEMYYTQNADRWTHKELVEIIKSI